MKLISLGGKNGVGFYAQVDDADFERANQYNWCYDRHFYDGSYHGYAVRGIHIGWRDENMPKNNKNEIRGFLTLHHFILGVPNHIRIDHYDGEGLNDQRYNLRIATQHQNTFNRGKQSNNTSGYKGVVYVKSRSHLLNPWMAHIQVNGKTIYLGCFETAKDAAIAYNKAALKYFGEFAWLNPIDDIEDIEKDISTIHIVSLTDSKIKKSLYVNNTSGFRGVTRDNNRWAAYIYVNGKRIFLGRYKDIREAAIAFNKASVKYFGKDAYQNPL